MKKLLAILLFAMTITQMQAAIVRISAIENGTDEYVTWVCIDRPSGWNNMCYKSGIVPPNTIVSASAKMDFREFNTNDTVEPTDLFYLPNNLYLPWGNEQSTCKGFYLGKQGKAVDYKDGKVSRDPEIWYNKIVDLWYGEVWYHDPEKVIANPVGEPNHKVCEGKHSNIKIAFKESGLTVSDL